MLNQKNCVSGSKNTRVSMEIASVMRQMGTAVANLQVIIKMCSNPQDQPGLVDDWPHKILPQFLIIMGATESLKTACQELGTKQIMNKPNLTRNLPPTLDFHRTGQTNIQTHAMSSAKPTPLLHGETKQQFPLHERTTINNSLHSSPISSYQPRKFTEAKLKRKSSNDLLFRNNEAVHSKEIGLITREESESKYQTIDLRDPGH